MKKIVPILLFLLILITFLLISCTPNATSPTPSSGSSQSTPTQPTPTQDYAIATPYVLPTHTQAPIITRHNSLSTIDLNPPPPTTIIEENFLRVRQEAYIDLDQGTAFAIPKDYFDWLLDDQEIDMSNWNLSYGTMDFQFIIQQENDITSLFIDPWNNNLIGTLQADQEDNYENCLLAPKQYAGFTYELTESMPIFCIKTSSDNFATFQIRNVTKINPDLENSEYQIEFTYQIWNDDGQAYPKQPSILLENHLAQDPAQLDLDQINTLRIPDLSIEKTDEALTLTALNNTQLSRWRGDKIPTYALCASSAYSTEPITLPIDNNALLFACYKTSEGKLGRIMLRGNATEENQALQTRTFALNYETWGIDPLITPVTSINHVSMHYGQSIDLDQSSFISAPENKEFRLYTTTDDQINIIPNTIAPQVQIANIGSARNPIEQCQTAAFSNVPILIDTLEPNHWICFKTNHNRTGALEIESITTQAGFPEKTNLSFQVLLFDQTQTYHLLHPQIKHYFNHLISTIPVDLEELGVAGKQDFGIRKEQSQTLIYPVSGAKITYWGTSNPTYAECQTTNIQNQISGPALPVQPDWQPPTAKTYFCIITAENNWGSLRYNGRIGDQFNIEAELWQLDPQLQTTPNP